MANHLSAENPPPSLVESKIESKSARKKKGKAEVAAALNGGSNAPAVPQSIAKEDSSIGAKEGADNGHTDHPYVRELTKHIRNVHKKLTGLHKTEAIIAENPGKSLEDLVKEKKINADQKSSIQKKPQLEAQLKAYEEQIEQYKKVDADYQTQMQKQRDDLTAQHEAALTKAQEDARMLGVTNSAAELRKKLLVLSKFLMAAAAKRQEDDQEPEENRAFEGVLLQVYGGNDKAVQAAINLIEGSGEQVVDVDGNLLNVNYSQIKQSSLAHTSFQTEENWVDSVAEANATSAEKTLPIHPGSDPTIAYAGLTELDTKAGSEANNIHGKDGEDPLTSPPQANAGDAAGNAAGDKWDPAAPGGADRTLLAEEEYEMVPRPSDELENPAGAKEGTMSWADDHPSSLDAVGATGNQAGESWDAKTAGEEAALADAAAAAGASGNVDGAAEHSRAAGEDADGFHQVAGRHHRGRGGRGRGFDGEFRGRGSFRGRGERGGFRGDRGEFRGRGGFRGRGEGGEFRGRGGGRGRGMRGAPAEGPRAPAA